MNEYKKYKLLTFLRFLGDAFFYPFLALYLNSTGLKEAKIGIILALTPIISIIVNPIYTSICKNIKITRDVLKIVSIVEGICIAIIPHTNNFWVLFILVCLIGIFGTSHYSLMDSLLSVFAEENNKMYSSIRIYGSIAYIVATMLAGYTIVNDNYKICFAICSFLFIITSIMYQFLKPITIRSEKEGKKRNIKAVLTNKPYWAFLIYYCITRTSLAIVKPFFSLFLQNKGVSTSQYGLIYAMIVIAETITIIVMRKFGSKFKDIPTLIIANIMVVFMFIINGTDAPLWIIIIIANARGICWGIMIHISCRRVIKLVGTENDTFALMVMGLAFAFCNALANAISGDIIEKISYSAFYYIFAMITLIASIVLYISFRCNRQKNEEIEAMKI